MELLKSLLHLDETLYSIIQTYHDWTHAILFLIIFCETGLIIMPFLPGDSLLFVAGSLAAKGLLNTKLLYILLLIASTLGNMVNYTLGRTIGRRVKVSQTYILKTQEYYEKYGSLTLIVSRFLPIIRTFAPFLAGVVKMDLVTYFFYTILGGFIWVTSLFWAGHFFGNIPFVKNHLTAIILGIILASLIPPILLFFKSKKQPEL